MRRIVVRRHVPVAMAGIQSHPARGPVMRGSSLSGSSLGDDQSTQDFQTQLLALNQQQADASEEWVRQDRRLRYQQMAVTAAIPVFAWAWGKFLGWRKSRSTVL